MRPVFGPFKGPAERMPGIRLQQVLSPNADQLYTLYSSAQPGYAPHQAPCEQRDGVVRARAEPAGGWAHCVGLPEELWDRPASEQAMATSPNGRLLYIVDATLGLVTVMDTASLEIRTASIDLSVSGVRHTSAVVSSTARRCSSRPPASTGDHADRHGHVRGGSQLDTDDVSGLGLSSDGERLYVAFDDRVEVWTRRPDRSSPGSRSRAPPRSNA